jgi:hypothetical protein
MYTTLEIYSHENADNVGYWEKADVEDEMRELGCEVKDDDNWWIEYVLDHLEIDEWVYQVIINPNFVSGKFKSDMFGDLVVKKS